MPVLNWIGKSTVINHHKDVPFKFLKRNDSKSMGNSENLLIEGDNMEALKSLLPYYKGKIKCIYIDPPYNTGNEHWVYNDNINSPKIKKWLGHVVGIDDLTRHDKWLCMMYPRLKLLQKLLKDDGLIFVQIDYRELNNLKILLDDIFLENLISIITVKVKDAAGVGQESPIFDVCEYILIYANNLESGKKFLLDNSHEFLSYDDVVKGYKISVENFGKKKFVKEIERGNVGKIKIYSCENFEVKKFGKNTDFNYYLQSFETLFADYNPSGGMINAIKHHIPQKGLSYIEYVPIKGRDAGKKSKVYFYNRRTVSWLKNIATKTENNTIEKRQKITNLWEISNAGLSNEGSVQFVNGKKPLVLLRKIISLATEKNDIVLDSFTGSGTTGHAILSLNKEDGGNRKFILIELEPKIAKNITSKRLSTVIKSIGEKGGGVPKILALHIVHLAMNYLIKMAKLTLIARLIS